MMTEIKKLRETKKPQLSNKTGLSPSPDKTQLQ